jgi:lactate permease
VRVAQRPCGNQTTRQGRKSLLSARFDASHVPRIRPETPKSFHWPGLDVTIAGGGEPPTATFALNWLATPGTALLLSGLLTMLVLRIPPRVALRAYTDTVVRLRGAILTITAVLALAYVMNLEVRP